MGNNKTISGLEVKNFTVFEDQVFRYCKGVNVVIGENGAGKSHMLKLLYAATYVCWKRVGMFGVARNNIDAIKASELSYQRKINNVFSRSAASHDGIAYQVDKWFRNKDSDIVIIVTYSAGSEEKFSLHMTKTTSLQKEIVEFPEEPIFIPSADMLSQYRGLIYRYERGYETRDETYRDLCSALSGESTVELNDSLASVVKNIETVIGGEIVLKDNEFFIRSGKKFLHTSLAAEGHRKLATIAHLIKNGTLRQGSILFWDEPETNLNPKLIVGTVEIIKKLADSGVQVFVATHDFLLTNEFGVSVEYQIEPVVPVKFFSLYREKKKGPTVHESSDKLQSLRHNAILEEFAAHYDREAMLFENYSGSNDEND